MADIEGCVRRLVADVWNAKREESAYELVSHGCPGLDGVGPAAIIAWHRDRRTAFPDLRYRIVDLVVSGNRAALHWRAAGTQAGAFGPVSPTGRVVSYSGATFLHFNDEGLITDTWSVNEMFGLLQQLGVRVTAPVDTAGTADTVDRAG